MPVTEFLERNAKLYPDEIALVELNPEQPDTRQPGRNMTLSDLQVSKLTEEKSPGKFLMR